MPGSAMGFLNTPCMQAPETASAPPTRMDRRMRGMRTPATISRYVPFPLSLPRIRSPQMRSVWERGMPELPTVQATAARATMASSSNRAAVR